jgi:hypothetical protein
MPKLQHLGISGPHNYSQKPFFEASRLWVEADPDQRADIMATYEPAAAYTPDDFEEAVRDLGNGCRTLQTISLSSRLAEWFPDDRTARIIRSERGEVEEVIMHRWRGRVIGREQEW